MMIPCPYCGERDAREFGRRGEVPAKRPELDAGAQAFVAHMYERTNPAGPTEEYWQHEAGCREWLVVARDTRTHEVIAARSCRDRAR